MSNEQGIFFFFSPGRFFLFSFPAVCVETGPKSSGSSHAVIIWEQLMNCWGPYIYKVLSLDYILSSSLYLCCHLISSPSLPSTDDFSFFFLSFSFGKLSSRSWFFSVSLLQPLRCNQNVLYFLYYIYIFFFFFSAKLLLFIHTVQAKTNFCFVFCVCVCARREIVFQQV